MALVLANRRRETCKRIEAPVFLTWGIVEEVPEVEESIARNAAARTVLQIKETSNFTAELNGVASVNLGGYILAGVSPLVQNAANVRSKGIDRNTAGLFNKGGGKSDGSLRVGRYFIPAPSSSIQANSLRKLDEKV